MFRIGVNLGDVMVEANDVYGNGVNVAARLEGMAEAGGICLSERVFEDAENVVDAEFVFLGRQKVKNIERSIGAYAVRLFPDDPLPHGTISRRASKRSAAPLGFVGVCVALLAILAVAGWVWVAPYVQKTVMTGGAGIAEPKRPSIAVLPFANLSGDEDERYFADGITDDLTTDLSRVSGLFVIARNSAFAFRDVQESTAEIAEALGVRYLLQGSVRRVGGRLRINAQLTDTRGEETVWADRYDGGMEDVFALQDAVTRQIVSVLSVQLTRVEEAVLSQRETAVPAAHDAFLKGWEHYLAQTPEDLSIAIDQFEEAIAIDPEYGEAHAAIAAAYWQIGQRWWHGHFGFPNFHRVRAHAETLLHRALRWETPLAHQLAVAVLSQQGRHTEALAEGSKALALDPNDADSFAALSGAMSLAGDADNALSMIRQAMRLNPRSPASYHYKIGLAEFGLGNFSRAAAALEEAIRLNPEDRWSTRLLVATYGHLDRRADVEAIIERDGMSWFGTDPFTIRAVSYWYPYARPTDLDRLTEGLRKAGLPD